MRHQRSYLSREDDKIHFDLYAIQLEPAAPSDLLSLHVNTCLLSVIGGVIFMHVKKSYETFTLYIFAPMTHISDVFVVAMVSGSL